MLFTMFVNIFVYAEKSPTIDFVFKIDQFVYPMFFSFLYDQVNFNLQLGRYNSNRSET